MCVSIHEPVMDAEDFSDGSPSDFKVSIHAPVMDANNTGKICTAW